MVVFVPSSQVGLICSFSNGGHQCFVDKNGIQPNHQINMQNRERCFRMKDLWCRLVRQLAVAHFGIMYRWTCPSVKKVLISNLERHTEQANTIICSKKGGRGLYLRCNLRYMAQSSCKESRDSCLGNWWEIQTLCFPKLILRQSNQITITRWYLWNICNTSIRSKLYLEVSSNVLSIAVSKLFAVSMITLGDSPLVKWDSVGQQQCCNRDTSEASYRCA